MEESLQRIEAIIRCGLPHKRAAVNADKLRKASKDPELRRVINECALINVDGVPVVWASRLLGKPLKERVAGIDLFEFSVERAAEKGWRVFFLGAREESVQALKALYEKRFPHLQVAGYRNGYWRSEEETSVVKLIAD